MAQVYITGDTHGQFDRIADFCSKANTTPSDILIILGDAGINYYGNWRDTHLKDRIAKLPITLFCIHGNHEMRPCHIRTYAKRALKSPAINGVAYTECAYPNIAFAIDGEVYDISGNKCIAIGGAYSVDKFYRLACGARWFRDEQPDENTKQKVESMLASYDNKIDIVLSHTCPHKYIPREMFLPQVDQSTVDDSTELWLDRIESSLDYKQWFCGHYHTDKTIDRVRFMLNDIITLGKDVSDNGA